MADPYGIDWGALQQPNILGNFVAGHEAGAKLRKDRSRREGLNLLATDPVAGANALIASDNSDAVTASFGARNVLGEYQAKEAAKPFAAKGDYRGASRAAAEFDLEASRKFAAYGQEELDRTRKQAERSAAVLMSAAQIPDPVQRRAFIDQHATELEGLGYSREQIAGYDVSDATKMRADASRFLDLGTIAGKVSVEKFGDYAVTYDTNPVTGTRAVSRSEIPPTRAERRQDQEFDYRREHDAEELAFRREQERRRAQEASDPYSSPSRVMGPILAKIARGETLTPGEQRLYTDYRTARAQPDDFMAGDALGGDYGAPGTPAPAAAPTPSKTPAARPGAARGRPADGRSAASPVQPRSRAEAEALPSGTWFRDPAGNLIQKR